jgi:DNA ligase-1
VEIAVGLLSGIPRQGRIGIGWSALDRRVPASAEKGTLTLEEVDSILQRVAAASGPGAGAVRLRLVSDLMARATGAEQDFLARLVLGELRQGALEGVMVEAVAKAAGLPVDAIKRAVMLAGDLGLVARAALVEGQPGLARFSVRLFRPLKPMLAEGAVDTEDALSQLGRAAFEYKLDGARIQAHKSGREVRIFTRRLNEVTAAVPEIVEAVQRLPARERVLDGEALALRPDGRPRPFQTTMRRLGRKADVGEMRHQLPLRPFFFDCLWLEGEPVLDRPERERFAALADAVPAETVVPHLETGDAGEARAFLQQALREGHEGVMAKAVDAPYEAGLRRGTWLKVKRARTLDLVVLAAEWGHGRRRGWLSNLHLGARDPASGGFVMLGKTFKGMTDAMLEWQTKKLLELEIGRDDYTVYVRPELVVEVAFNEIQASPHYPGGMALRFARVRAYRRDKNPQDADTIESVRALYQGPHGDKT